MVSGFSLNKEAKENEKAEYPSHENEREEEHVGGRKGRLQRWNWKVPLAVEVDLSDALTTIHNRAPKDS